MNNEIESNFDLFADSAYSNTVLEPKTAFLIKIGVSMALGCYP